MLYYTNDVLKDSFTTLSGTDFSGVNSRNKIRRQVYDRTYNRQVRKVSRRLARFKKESKAREKQQGMSGADM
jgi:hypothetical protein